MGVSSGVGPFTAYQRVGGGGRRRSAGGYGGGYSYGPTKREIAAMEREQRRLEKEAEIDQVEKEAQSLVKAHLENFSMAKAPRAPEPQSVDVDAIRARLEREGGIPDLAAKAGGGPDAPVAPEPEPVDRAALKRQFRTLALEEVPVLRFGERRATKQKADQQAEEAAQAEEKKRAAEQDAKQRELDRHWNELQEKRAVVNRAVEQEAASEREQRAKQQQKRRAELDREWEELQENDPATVVAVLEAAFADNSAPAAPINCEGETVTVTMKFKGPEIVPERMGDYTPTGKLTLKKRPKASVNALYLESLSSHVLATVREALAVAPGIENVSVLVLREESKGKNAGLLGAVYAGQFTRQGNRPDSSGHWRNLDVIRAIEDAPGSMLNLKGVAEEVSPLDLRAEPDLQEVLERVAEDINEVPISAGTNRSKRSRAKSRSAKEVLTEVNEESDPHKRWDALWSLHDRRLDLSIVDPLSELALTDPDTNVRAVAIELLAEIGNRRVAEALTKVAKDPQPYLREQAIGALEQVAPDDQEELFTGAANDPDPRVRQAAVRALETNGSDRSFGVIANAISDPDPTVRYFAVAALIGRDDPAAKVAVETAQNDPDPKVREMAANSDSFGIVVTTSVH